MPKTKTFGDYKAGGHKWITLATGEYYPDILKDACELYKPVLVGFSRLLKSSDAPEGRFPERRAWSSVGFDVGRLQPA